MLGWRPGVIYAYSTLDAETGDREPWAYVGQTRQELYKRHNQHIACQPWSDLFPEVRIVFKFKHCPDWWLTLTEKLVIKFTKPLYNYEYNTKNPRRIPIYQAKADREMRDRLARMRRFW